MSPPACMLTACPFFWLCSRVSHPMTPTKGFPLPSTSLMPSPDATPVQPSTVLYFSIWERKSSMEEVAELTVTTWTMDASLCNKLRLARSYRLFERGKGGELKRVVNEGYEHNGLWCVRNQLHEVDCWLAGEDGLQLRHRRFKIWSSLEFLLSLDGFPAY